MRAPSLLLCGAKERNFSKTVFIPMIMANLSFHNSWLMPAAFSDFRFVNWLLWRWEGTSELIDLSCLFDRRSIHVLFVCPYSFLLLCFMCVYLSVSFFCLSLGVLERERESLCFLFVYTYVCVCLQCRKMILSVFCLQSRQISSVVICKSVTTIFAWPVPLGLFIFFRVGYHALCLVWAFPAKSKRPTTLWVELSFWHCSRIRLPSPNPNINFYLGGGGQNWP